MYDDLYDVIGTSFGDGNGSTTFNVPDFRGRAPLGTGIGTGNNLYDDNGGSEPTVGSGALTVRELGEWGGQETFAIAEANLPDHNHALSGNTGKESATLTHTVSESAHTHPYNLWHAGSTSGVTHHGDTVQYNGTNAEVWGTVNTNGATTGLTVGNHSSHTHALSGNTGGTGSGTAMTFQQRAMPFLCVNYIIAT